MPVINYKNINIDVPNIIGGVAFEDVTTDQMLSFLKNVEQNNPEYFSGIDRSTASNESLNNDESLPSDEGVGFFEGVGNALGRGANHLTTGLAVAANRAGALSDEATAEQVATDIVDMRQYPMSDSVKSGMQQIQEAEGFGDSALAIVENPGAVFDVAVQSLVSSVPSLVGMFAGGLAGGLVGSVPGAVIGAASGAGLGSYGVEWSATVVEQMRKEGVDLDDVDQVEAFLADDLKMKKVGAYAEKRAVPIAAFDAITAGVAGRLVSPVRKAVAGKALVKNAEEVGRKAGELAREKYLRQANALSQEGYSAKEIAKGAARAEVGASNAASKKVMGGIATGAGIGVELGVQAVGGGLGEATAQISSEGKITSPGEVLLEMFAELPTALIETGVGVGSSKREQSRLRASGLIDEEVINNSYLRLNRAGNEAPPGATYEQRIDFSNIYNDSLEPVVIYSDKNNFILGDNETVANNLLNSNLDILEDGDKVKVVNPLVVNNKNEPVLDKNGNKQYQGITLEVEDNQGSLTAREIGKINYKEEAIVPTSNKLTNLKFETEEQAANVADIINNNLSSSLEQRNKNFGKVSAMWSALSNRKELNKESRKENRNKNKFRNKKTIEKKKILNDTNMSSLTTEEIQNEINNQSFLFTPQQYTIALKSVFKNKKFNFKQINKDLRIENARRIEDGKPSSGLSGRLDFRYSLDVYPISRQLKKELQNRQIIGAGGQLLKRYSNIDPAEIISTSDAYGTGDAQSLQEAIEEQKLSQTAVVNPIIQRQSEETIDQGDPIQDVDTGQKATDKKRSKSKEKNELNKQKNKLSYSNNFIAQFKDNLLPKLYRNLQNITGVSSKSISIEFVQDLENNASAALSRNDSKYIIEISTKMLVGKNQQEAREILGRILSEEGFHIIYDLSNKGNQRGPFQIKDLKNLESVAKKLKVPGSNQTWFQQAQEENRRESPEIQLEEAVASLFYHWSKGNFRNLIKNQPTIARLFNDIFEFFFGVSKALKQSSRETRVNIDTLNTVFSKVTDPIRIEKNNLAIREAYENFDGNKLENVDNQNSEQQEEEIKNDGLSRITSGNTVSSESKQTAANSINSNNTDTNLKLSPGAKDQLNIKYKFVRDTTPNWLLNEQKKTISNQRTSDPGLTVLDLTSKGRWGRAIDAIGSKVRKNFINDLDYLSVLEQETASQQGDLMADVSSHAAAQLAKNAAAITAGVLTGKGVPVYQSSSEVGGLGITLNEIFETEQPINVLVRDENGEALLDEKGQPQYRKEKVEIGGLLDTVLDEVLLGGEQMEKNFHHYRIAKREFGLQNATDGNGNLLFPLRIFLNTSQRNEQIVNQYEQSFPFFLETSDKLDAFFDKIIDFKVNTGLISRDQAGAFKDSISYIPLYRDIQSSDKFSSDNGSFVEAEGIITEKEAGKDLKIDISNAPPSLKETDQTKRYRIILNGSILKDKNGNIVFDENGNPKYENQETTVLDQSFKTLREAKAFIEKRVLKESAGTISIKHLETFQIEETKAPVGGMLNNILINISQTIEQGTKNVAAQRIIRDGVRYNTIVKSREFVDEDDKKAIDESSGIAGVTSERGGSNVSIRVNGKSQGFYVHDPMLFQSLMSMNMNQSIGDSILAKTFTVPANVLREMVTRDPGFMLANFLRDSLSAYVTSGRIGTPIVSSIKGIMNAVNVQKGSSADVLERAGVKGGIDLSFSKEESTVKQIDIEMRKLYPERYKKGALSKGIGPLKYIWDKLERGTEISDLATRIAVYNEVLSRTGNKAQAIWEAQEVLNFRRRGAYMKFVSAAIPFLNARIQGLDILYRGFTGRGAAGADLSKGKLKRLAMMRGMYLVGFTSLLWFLQSDDEEFEMINDAERDNNWVILGKYFGKPDSYLKIPIPFEVGLIFKTIPDRILSQAFGSDVPEDARRSFRQAIFGTLQIAPPTAVAPIIETFMNYNFLTGRSILKPYEQTDIDPRLVASGSTSELAQAISEILYPLTPGGTELTPKEIDNIIRGYSGTLGSYLVTVLDAVIPTDITKPSRHIEDYPVVSRVLGELKSGSGATGEIYQLFESTRRATSSIKGYEISGDQDRINQIIRRDFEYLSTKDIINESRKRITEINKQLSSLRFANKTRSLTKQQINEERDILEEARRMELLNIKEIKKSIKGLS